MKLENRIKIEIRLKDNESIRSIAKELNIHASTVLREITKNKTLIKNKKVLELKKTTDKEILDNHLCELLKKSPYVCNGCPRYINNHCNYHFIVYRGEISNANSIRVRKEANNRITDIKIKIIIEINKRLRLGQPLSHIYLSLKEQYKENMISMTTIYNYANKGIINYVKKEVRKQKQEVKKDKLEYRYRENYLKDREYINYLKYISDNNVNTVEMDLVCGVRGSNGYILTIFIPNIQFLMAYKLENKTPFEVVRVLDDIESKIGFNKFKKMFGVILTDRGTEFLKYQEICYSKKTLRKRTKIFYCDKGSPTQKAPIENIHRLLRRVYPKGMSLKKVTQDDLYEVVSNINSLKKTKEKGKSPNELFIEKYGRTLLNKLLLKEYNNNEVVLLKNNTKNS